MFNHNKSIIVNQINANKSSKIIIDNMKVFFFPHPHQNNLIRRLG